MIERWQTQCPLCKRLAPIGDGPNAEFGKHRALKLISKNPYRVDVWECPAVGYGWLDLQRLLAT